LVVSLGGGTTELAVISLGGIVINKSLRVAGDEMDEMIVNFLRLKYSILIGLPTAENLKIQIGSACLPAGKPTRPAESTGNDEKQAVIRGRDLASGLPRSLRVSASEVREAIAPALNQFLAGIESIIEETPPELLGDIVQGRIYLTGGIAQLPGFPSLVTEAIKLPCQVLEQPMTAVVKGCGRILEDENLLRRIKVTGGVK